VFTILSSGVPPLESARFQKRPVRRAIRARKSGIFSTWSWR